MSACMRNLIDKDRPTVMALPYDADPVDVRWPVNLAVAALLAVVAIIGCGDDQAAGPGAQSDAQTATAVGDVAADKGTLAGMFAAATESEGYTVEMSYEITGLGVEVDIANADPGEARIVPQATGGTFTITNTTDGRNTEIELARPAVGLLWKASSVPSAIQVALRQADEDHCTVEFRGQQYCSLARVTFESTPEANVLDPGGQISLTAELPPSDPRVGGLFGIYEIAEEQADPLASFVRATDPELVWVSADIAQGRGTSATWSCATSTASAGGRTKAASGYMAILDDAGRPLVEGGGITFYGAAGELCSEA